MCTFRDSNFLVSQKRILIIIKEKKDCFIKIVKNILENFVEILFKKLRDHNKFIITIQYPF